MLPQSTMGAKYEIITSAQDDAPRKPQWGSLLKAVSTVCVVLLCIGGAAKYYLHRPVFDFESGYCPTKGASAQPKGVQQRLPATVNYDLTIGQAWKNPGTVPPLLISCVVEC